MNYLFSESADCFFIEIANLNSQNEVSIDDFISAFENDRELDIEFFEFQKYWSFEFYYTHADVPIMIIPCHPDMLIKLLKENINIVDQVIFEDRDFSDLLSIVDKKFYISLFNSLYRITENKSKRAAFREAYTSIEFDFDRINRSVIEDSFLNTTEDERSQLKEKLDKVIPGETVTIYRGQNSDSTPLNKTISWTLDNKVAKFFATRFNSNGDIYKATVRKDKIRWLFEDRNESEVIVFFDDIENLEIMKTTEDIMEII